MMHDKELMGVLESLRSELAAALGEQLVGVYLYGSRARGDARPDSDVDVLVVVRGDFDYGDLIRRTSEIVARLSMQNDLVISRAFVSDKQFSTGQSEFLLNVHRDAVPV